MWLFSFIVVLPGFLVQHVDPLHVQCVRIFLELLEILLSLRGRVRGLRQVQSQRLGRTLVSRRRSARLEEMHGPSVPPLIRLGSHLSIEVSTQDNTSSAPMTLAIAVSCLVDGGSMLPRIEFVAGFSTAAGAGRIRPIWILAAGLDPEVMAGGIARSESDELSLERSLLSNTSITFAPLTGCLAWAGG